jgi:hypothetical protein
VPLATIRVRNVPMLATMTAVVGAVGIVPVLVARAIASATGVITACFAQRPETAHDRPPGDGMHGTRAPAVVECCRSRWATGVRRPVSAAAARWSWWALGSPPCGVSPG